MSHKKKTPISQVVEYIEKMQSLDAVINPMDIIKQKCISLLEDEREFFISAVCLDKFDNEDDREIAEQYFDKKYESITE